jgi:hypothetical protein
VNDHDEARRLRVRDEDITDALTTSPYLADPGSPCLVLQTKALTAYPSAAQSFFACVPVTVLGTEIEGGQAALTPLTPTLFAFNLGAALPPQGTNVIASYVGNRWVFRYDA